MICEIVAPAATPINYCTLGLWGKPVIWYPIRAALDSGVFDCVLVCSEDPYVRFLVEKYFSADVRFGRAHDGAVLDGRAALITPEAIRTASASAPQVGRFDLLGLVPEAEPTVLVNSTLAFELSLTMLRKRDRANWLRQDILHRMAEKRSVLENGLSSRSICLIGHSQFDQWSIQMLSGYSIRNCGISGITTREYLEDIFKRGLFSYEANAFLILLGVNDLATSASLQEIADDMNELVDMLTINSAKPVFFVEPLLVNGRIDHSNSDILMLRRRLKDSPLVHKTVWIETDAMDDPYGNLNLDFTVDGLHLNPCGYDALEQIISKNISSWEGKKV